MEKEKMKRMTAVYSVSAVLLCLVMQFPAFGEVKEYESGNSAEGIWVENVRQGPGVNYYKGNGRMEGFWSDDKMEGHAIHYREDGGREIFTYWDGKANGLGLIISADGSLRGGIWEDNSQKNGVELANWTEEDGTRYFAEKKSDAEGGKAIAVYSNGNIYIGDMADGKPDGWGTYYYSTSGWHTGLWEDGLQNGAGYYYFSGSQNTLYRKGFWKNGRQQGGGVQYNKDGAIVFTQYKEDKADGMGVTIRENSGLDFTEYKDGTISNSDPATFVYNGWTCAGTQGQNGLEGEGLALQEKDGGHFYAGGFTNGKRNGQGGYFWKDSDNLYDGQWTEDRGTGNAVKVWANGDYYEGLFENENRTQGRQYFAFRGWYDGGLVRGENGMDKRTSGVQVTLTKGGGSTAQVYENGESVSNAVVTIYDGSSYTGISADFEVGKYDAENMPERGFFTDRISSIKIPEGFSVTVYKEKGFAGESQTFTRNISLNGSEWDDEISSFEVKRAE